MKRNVSTLPFVSCLVVLAPFFCSAGTLRVAELPEVIHKQTEQLNKKYYIYLPEAVSRSKALPLLIFLHGRGECGESIERVAKHGPPKLIQAGQAFPFVVVSPQCKLNARGKGRWRTEDLDALLQQVRLEHNIDENRIYLTGISMGGYGAWAWAAKRPDLFAAVVPICGGGNPKTASRIAHLPIRVFHGAKDKKVPLEKSREMVRALRLHRSSVELTVYPEVGHDSWTRTYGDAALFEWISRQQRSVRLH